MVTGGTTGIGRTIVERLNTEGAAVVTCARNEPWDPLPEGAMFVAADITDEGSVTAVIDAAIERHGHLDVLVANAGTANIGQWPDEPVDEWRELIDINLTGTMLSCKAAWRHLVASTGSVVVVSSLSAWMGVGRHELEQMGGLQPSPAYQASKAGVEGLAKHLAGRGGEHGVRVPTSCGPAASSPISGRGSSATRACSGPTTRRSSS